MSTVNSKVDTEEVFIASVPDMNNIDDILVRIGEEPDENGGVKEFLCEIFKRHGASLTIVCEKNYVDRVYRDTYYNYFAVKYRSVSRDCKRLFIFSGALTIDDFLSYDNKSEDSLQEHFIGVTVLKPLAHGKIGRTLLAPDKMNVYAYVRATEFSFFLFGHELTVEAFPYSQQDGEMMTCAETTIWNILEYYGTRYPEYRTVLPSEMLHLMEQNTCERNLPSKGLLLYDISFLMKKFGFSPRIYSKGKDRDVSRFHRMFHYYVESGFPLAVAVTSDKLGHAVVCVGHEKLSDVSGEHINDLDFLRLRDYPCINSADMYDRYVMVDDNQFPYQVESFDEFTLYSREGAKVDCFVVPLPKRVFLEAMVAENIARSILGDASLGLSYWGEEAGLNVNRDNPLVFRLFLTSARKYRGVRIRNSGTDSKAQKFYGRLSLPRFVWVAEFAKKSDYDAGMIAGEVVIDATSVINVRPTDSVIFIRYCNIFLQYRNNWKKRYTDNAEPYPVYENNLRLCGGGQ